MITLFVQCGVIAYIFPDRARESLKKSSPKSKFYVW